MRGASFSPSTSPICSELLTHIRAYRVLLDDTDMHDREGGGGFSAYGIDPQAGAIVVVRPDGYVGIVAPFHALHDIETYFAGFMLMR